MRIFLSRATRPTITKLTLLRPVHTSQPPDTKSPKHPPPDPSNGKPKKTMAQLDEEMRLKMEGISGDGGASGVEYEDGKAEGLRRGVKSNMFRVI